MERICTITECFLTTMTNVSVNRCVSCLICAVTDYIFLPKYTIVFTSFIRQATLVNFDFGPRFPMK